MERVRDAAVWRMSCTLQYAHSPAPHLVGRHGKATVGDCVSVVAKGRPVSSETHRRLEHGEGGDSRRGWRAKS